MMGGAQNAILDGWMLVALRIAFAAVLLSCCPSFTPGSLQLVPDYCRTSPGSLALNQKSLASSAKARERAAPSCVLSSHFTSTAIVLGAGPWNRRAPAVARVDLIQPDILARDHKAERFPDRAHHFALDTA